MGREVRMVPKDWSHPTKTGESGEFIPLYDGSDFEECAADWDRECAEWDAGNYPSYADEESKMMGYAEWNGERPEACDYMPDFLKPRPIKRLESKRWMEGRAYHKRVQKKWNRRYGVLNSKPDHLMMYETTTEGTPISPAFKTPEELAEWLANNNASSFGRSTATYEQWLKMIKGTGWAMSAVMDANGLRSGVEYLGDN